MNKRYLLCCISSLLIPLASFAQQLPSWGCGSDQVMQANIELLSKQTVLDKVLRLNIGGEKSLSDLPYTLPVVVHIVHQNGLENIPDAQVFAAIAHMNQAFAHEGYYLQQGDGTNTQIQFCLAQRTPDGQLTNGITRTESALTDMVVETQDLALKDLVRWDPTQYINIWVVSSITSASAGSGVAGYAYLAASHGMPNDGIVCEAATFGVDAAQEGVLIHEMGHYLNLYHTFEGGCGNGDCLSDGDRVCDTPPDQATHTACPYNSCSTDTEDTSANNPFNSNVDDLTENFMDYSPFGCYRNFTEGQGDRMRFAIEFFRSSLLQSEGCKNPCTVPISTAFLPSATTVTAGQTVNFTNQTLGATNYEWYVNGNLIATTFDFSYQFTGTGNALVELRAFNADPNCLGNATANITVACGVVAAFTTNPIALETGETLTCTNTSTGAATYQWFINGADVGTTTNLTYVFNTAGYYTVMLQAVGSYCSSSISIPLVVSSDNPCPDSITASRFHFEQAITGFGLHTTPVVFPNGDVMTDTYLPPKGLVAKYDANGNQLWQTIVNVPFNGLDDMCMQEDGGAIFTDDDDDIIKLNSNGALEWSKHVISPAATEFRAVPIEGGALVYTNGNVGQAYRLFLMKILSDGTIEWGRAYDYMGDFSLVGENAITVTENGFWICGFTRDDATILPNGGVILQFDEIGNLLTSKRYRLNNDDNISFYGIEANEAGEFVVSGVRGQNFTDNTYNTFLIKGNAAGNITWAKQFTQAVDNTFYHAHRVITKPSGGYLQKIRTDFDKVKWASWSESGQVQFIQEITSPGFLNEILEFNGKLFGQVMTAYNAKDFYWFNLNDDGIPIGCAIRTTANQQNTSVSFTVEDIAWTPASFIPNVQPGTLTTTTYSNPLLQEVICSMPAPCPEICDGGLDEDEDGYIDCFDSDCQCFDGSDCTTDAFAAEPIQGKLEWQSANLPGINTTPLVANLDPQNGDMPEIIVMEGISDNLSQATISKILFYQGDGSNASNPRVLSIPQLMNERNAAPVIGDVNSDGIPELAVVTWDDRIRVYSNYSPTNAQAMTLFATSDLTTNWSAAHLGLADFDGDGQPEIYSGNHVFQFDFTNPNSPQLKRRLMGTGHSGTSAWDITGTIAADLLSVADCNGDPDCAGLELVAGAVIFSIDLDPLDGDGLEIKTARNLSTMLPSDNFMDGYTYVADLDLDGVLDIVTTGRHGTANNFGLYAWNKNGLLRKFSAPFQQQFDKQFFTAAIANVFDDKTKGHAQDFPEIVFASSNYITAFNLQAALSTPASPWWWTVDNDDATGSSGPACFDFNADGFAEIVHRDEKSLRLMYGGPLPLPTGVDADRNWVKISCNSQTIDEYPVIADVDNDGEAEIVASGYSPPFVVGQPDYRGKLWIMGSDGLPWAPTRNIWNQFHYFGVNVNDDLTIPAHQQLHHLEFPSIGSGKRPFNTSHAQWSPLNDEFEPGFPVSDATVSVDSFACNGNNAQVWITLCNTGSSAIPAHYPIAFYKNDPRQPGAILETGISHGPSPIPVDSCVSLVVSMPTVFNAPIFVVVGDDASQAIPYSLSDFPISDVLECDYGNNFASFTLPVQGMNLDLGPDLVLCSSSVKELNAGAGFASYHWQNGSTDSTFTAYNPGKYWVDAYDLCGFLHTDTLVIALNQSASVDLGADRSLCSGESVTLEVAGFTDISWSPTTGLSCPDCPTVTATPTDTITYYVTAANGDCIASDSVRIYVAASPTLALVAQNGDCTTLAAITANASGNAPFAYQWSSGQTTQTILPAQAGTYAVTVTSAQGCTAIGSASVALNNSLQLAIQSTPLPCIGSFGEATVLVNGGTAPYSYEWSNGGNTSTVQVATSGNLSVTITDANGCISSGMVVVETIPEISLQLESTPVACGGQSGEAFVVVSGGTAPYAYAWSNGENTAVIQTSSPGDYTVTVTDAFGCTSEGTTTVGIIGSLLLDVQSSPVTCSGGFGEAAINASGGMAPYTYEWSNGGNTPSIEVNMPGSFTVTVTDVAGCASTTTVNVGLTGQLLLGITIHPISCFGYSDGTATIVPINGTPPYEWAWSNEETGPELTNISGGNFAVTVTDTIGCTGHLSFSIAPPTALELDISATNATCFGQNNGTATVIASGGTPGYNYFWSNVQTAATAVQLAPGWHTVTVTDENSCTDTTGILIAQPSMLSATVLVSDSLICQGSSTTVSVTPTGGTPPFSYLWFNGETDSLLMASTTGGYSVTVTDANDCEAIGTGFLQVLPLMMAGLDSIHAASSPTAADGSIFVDVTGGTQPFSYLWSNGATSQDLLSVAGGEYSLTITDAEGCEQVFQFTVDFLNATAEGKGIGWNAHIYPNPITGKGSGATLSIQSPRAQAICFQLFDITGKLIDHASLDIPAGIWKKPIQAPMAAGMYLILLSNEREVICLKWVVLGVEP